MNRVVPSLHENLGSQGIAVTYVNHATVLIQTQHFNILTDPVWSQRPEPFGLFGSGRMRNPGLSLDDLPDIDVILISHNHRGHLDVNSLRQLSRRGCPKVLVAAGDKARVELIGFNHVQELDWWQEVQLKDNLRIVFAPARHSSGRGLFDRNKSLWGSFMIEGATRRIYFGGDSGYSSHYSEIRHRLGPPDVAVIGIGDDESPGSKDCLYMNPTDAVKAHKDLGAALSIGMDFQSLRLSGKSAYGGTGPHLRTALSEAGVSERHFIALQQGETKVHRCPLNVAAALAWISPKEHRAHVNR